MKIITFLLFGVFYPAFCFGQSKTIATNTLKNNITQKDSVLIDSLFLDFSGNRPGAAVMIAKGNKLIYCKGFGIMDLDKKEKVTCNSKFYLASASKQFTAMAILKLIDQGKLTLKTTLKEIFPEFPEYGKQITIQQLLTHQSGLVEINKINDGNPAKLLTDNDRLKALMVTDSIAFPAGTKCEYSNTAFSVLAEIVSKLSGIPFDEFMEKEIFSIADMNATNYYQNNKNPNIGYQILEDTIQKANGISDATMGSGSVYTSPNDYFKWHLALSQKKLISHSIQEKAYTAQEGTKNNWGQYGYGWVVLNNDVYNYVEHGGISQSAGFTCFTARIPEEDITVAIFTNRGWSKHNIPSQNIGTRAKVLLSIATNRNFPMVAMEDIDPKPKVSLAQALIDDILANGIESGKAFFQLKKDSKDFYLKEEEVNRVGYALVNMDRIKDAIEVFKLNAEQFPQSWNVFDSLAEMYLKDGNKKLAIENYEKSIKLNPKNSNGISILKELKKQ
ncbi:MAG: serine hydrolase [Balneola sp.]